MYVGVVLGRPFLELGCRMDGQLAAGADVREDQFRQALENRDDDRGAVVKMV